MTLRDTYDALIALSNTSSRYWKLFGSRSLFFRRAIAMLVFLGFPLDSILDQSKLWKKDTATYRFDRNDVDSIMKLSQREFAIENDSEYIDSIDCRDDTITITCGYGNDD